MTTIASSGPIANKVAYESEAACTSIRLLIMPSTVDTAILSSAAAAFAPPRIPDASFSHIVFVAKRFALANSPVFFEMSSIFFKRD